MRHCKIEIYREDRWWMIAIPELDGLTQARRLSEAELMAREYIAVDTGTPLADVTVSVISITVPELGDLHAEAEMISELRETARQAEARAAESMRQLARKATRAGIPVRDTAVLLDVSPQRVSQLAAGSQSHCRHMPTQLNRCLTKTAGQPTLHSETGTA